MWGAMTHAVSDENQLLLVSLAQVRDLSKSDLNFALCDHRIANELSAYRQQLTRIRELLPEIQIRLLSERASLEKKRLQLASASAWAESNRKTLAHR